MNLARTNPTFRSKKGPKLLRAVKDAKGRFKDIESYVQEYEKTPRPVNVWCPMSSCIYQHINGYCTKEEIELEQAEEDTNSLFCKQWREE